MSSKTSQPNIKDAAESDSGKVSDDSLETRYQVGDECKTGQKISEILGCGIKAAVFKTEDNHLRWEYFENNGEPPLPLQPAIREFNDLFTIIKGFVPLDKKVIAYERLGKALFSTLQTGEIQKRSFANARKFAETSTMKRAQFAYIIGAICAGVVFSLIGIAILSSINDPTGVQTILASILGALVSVLQRGSVVKVDLYDSFGMNYLLGVSRLILGVLFGVFAWMAVNGNLIFGNMQESDYSVGAILFFAGFSERFVPELLSKMEINFASQLESKE